MSDIASSNSVPNEAKRGSAVRKPLQVRSQRRVEAALATAAAMLETMEPEDISIPEVAKACNVPRACLYQFFPSKYALLAELAQRYLMTVAGHIEHLGTQLANSDWRQMVEVMVRGVCQFYNNNVVASRLILGGPFSRTSYLAQEVTIDHIGRKIRELIEQLDMGLDLPKDPDVATLAVEISFACLKHGYYREGFISEGIQQQAIDVTHAYFALWEKAGQEKTGQERAGEGDEPEPSAGQGG